jgi:transcriptional regulator with XRE-family HTH domain
MDIRVQVGRNMQRIRKEANLSQEELAFECGLHRTYISGVERGIRNPTVLILDKIAKALRIPITDLVTSPKGLKR